jgi:DNA-binding transcriptional regulator YdaS (Cro superfamily)
MALDTLSISSLPPAEAAKRLSREVSDDWLAEFAGSLPVDSHRLSLQRILNVWGLSQSQAAETFGVTRQAVGKWIKRGIPAERLVTVADMDAATDILCHYLKPERIPAVVRRSAPRLGDISLLEMVAEGRSAEMLAAVRSMFMFGSASS